MSDLRAMLDGCRANPDDDLRHLVLADFVQEQGDETWAAFIRESVEWERVKRRKKGRKQRRVRRRVYWRMRSLFAEICQRLPCAPNVPHYGSDAAVWSTYSSGPSVYHHYWSRGIIRSGDRLSLWESMQPGLGAYNAE